MKPQHHTRAVSLTRILAFAGLLAFAPVSQAQTETDAVPAEPPSVMPMFDAGGDGWDDMWVSIYPELNHRDKTKDTDADGISDYDEMLRGTNPLIANEPVVPPTPEELAEMERAAKVAEKERKEAFAQRKAELAKFVVKPRRTSEGAAATRQETNKEMKKRLSRVAERRAASEAAKRARALEHAQQSEIARASRADGTRIDIVDVENGFPRFYTAHNVAAADTISTDEVRSGGSLGLSLDGTGTTIAFWDAGDVRISHQEFSTGGVRVTDMDGTNTLDAHATHVAGTLVAKGVYNLATGMSPNANLHAYYYLNDIAKIAISAANEEIRVSNHSYGLIMGWQSTSSGWVWYGNPAISQTEDYYFGYYDWRDRVPSQRTLNNAVLLQHIRAEHAESDEQPADREVGHATRGAELARRRRAGRSPLWRGLAQALTFAFSGS